MEIFISLLIIVIIYLVLLKMMNMRIRAVRAIFEDDSRRVPTAAEVNDLLKKAQADDSDASRQLGDYYWRNNKKNPQYLELSVKHYKKAAQADDPIALDALGDIYYNNLFAEPDINMQEVGIEYFIKAAELNMPSAIIELIYIYDDKIKEGEPLKEKKDYWAKKAIELAESGNVKMMLNLGLEVLTTEGSLELDIDKELAATWIEKAAMSGNAPAMIELGNMYKDGKVIEKNYKEAIIWYAKVVKEKGNIVLYKFPIGEAIRVYFAARKL